MPVLRKQDSNEVNECAFVDRGRLVKKKVWLLVYS